MVCVVVLTASSTSSSHLMMTVVSFTLCNVFVITGISVSWSVGEVQVFPVSQLCVF